LRAEQLAGNQAPAPKAGFVDKKYPLDKFPGPSAWISGDWKLHRVANKAGGNPSYRLYNLKKDVQEKTDLAALQPERLARLKGELAGWQKSVVNSLNGRDYK
jgi:arylsulfatase A-like enzyme